MEVNIGKKIWVNLILWVKIEIILRIVEMRWIKGIIINMKNRKKEEKGSMERKK